MDGENRRKKIIEYLENTKDPMSGARLANLLNVSRQVIVTDITLLRASGENISSTHRGYLLDHEKSLSRKLKVCHSDAEILDELYVIVDAGGKIIDVTVDHGIYGEIKAPLALSSRKDVDEFKNEMETGKISPLKHLTNDYHCHTIMADSIEILDFIEKKLKEKGYLIK